MRVHASYIDLLERIRDNRGYPITGFPGEKRKMTNLENWGCIYTITYANGDWYQLTDIGLDFLARSIKLTEK